MKHQNRFSPVLALGCQALAVRSIALVGFGMQYSRFGSGTYLRNVARELENLGFRVDIVGTNRYPQSRISPVLSLLTSIALTLRRWWRYHYILTNEGSGAFIWAPRKIAIIHHSAKEKAKRMGFSVSGMFGWALQLMNMKTSAGVVCISSSTYQTVASHLEKTPHRVIWNGVDHESFTQRSRNWKHALSLDDQLTLLYAARSSSHKNLGALISLAELIDTPFSIVLLGSKMSPVLKKEITKFPGVKIVNPGYVTLSKLIGYLSAADFYVNVSKLEGFGLVQVEAMACGTPVIALDTDENRQIIADGGVVVGSYAEMAKQIEDLWADKSNLRTLSERALSRSKRFSWKKTAIRLVQFAQEVTERLT